MVRTFSQSANWIDNAMMNVLGATLSNDPILGHPFRMHGEARLVVFEVSEV